MLWGKMSESRLMEIPNFPNYFAHVSGKIYSAKGKDLKELSLCPNNAGYIKVKMHDSKGIRQTLYVHRVMAMTFLNGIRVLFPERTQVNHKNKNKQDNSLVNLEWVTPSENSKHSARQ
jgi:hypothetical protein